MYSHLRIKTLTHQHLRDPRKRVAVKREDTAGAKVAKQDLATKQTPPTTQTRYQQADIKIKPEKISNATATNKISSKPSLYGVADTDKDDKKSIIPANRIKQEKRKSGQISATSSAPAVPTPDAAFKKRRSDPIAVDSINAGTPANKIPANRIPANRISANEIPAKTGQILPLSTAENQLASSKRQRRIGVLEQFSHKQSHDETVHENPKYEAKLNAARRGKARVELPSNDEDAGDVHEDPEAYRQSLILRLKGLQAREKVYLEEFGTDLPDLTEIPERLPRVYGEAIRKAKESQTLAMQHVDFSHPTMQEAAYNISVCAELSRYNVSFVTPQHP
jgi:hypothetical protein